jgi:fused signal recognition particle receptor
MSFLSSLRQRIAALFRPTLKEREEFLEELEGVLLEADLGPALTFELLERLKPRLASLPREEWSRLLKEELAALFPPLPRELSALGTQRPWVCLFAGVNGSGKTTTVAKLAWWLKREGKSVILGAADTFRAAAVEQLRAWAEKVGCPVVAQGEGADPAAVTFDTIQAACARSLDACLVDTAGRLESKAGLMAELEKVRRVAAKALPGAPHEVLLVLDGTTGQQGLRQAEVFHRALGVTGIVVTKLDGSARGGAIFAIERELGIPVKFLGTGERLPDLQPFSPRDYVDLLVP